jgi:hypothetical protein
MNWKWRRSNLPWPNLRHYPNIYLGLRKTTNNLSHNSLSLGRDLKPGPHGYEARVLTTTTFGGTRFINICAYIYKSYTEFPCIMPSGTDLYYLEAVKTISEFRAIAIFVIWTQKCFTQNTSPNSISYAPHLMWMCVTSNVRRSGKNGDNAKCRISVLHVPYRLKTSVYVSWTSHVRSECCNEI